MFNYTVPLYHVTCYMTGCYNFVFNSPDTDMLII